MSIGFLGVSSSQKTVDVFSGNATSVVDRSLQGNLSNYNSIRTDTNRLIDSAVRGSFDISSQQYYNRYTREAVTGWSETWYAEYKAVLALRADALQKKLQAAYNRVLDKSAYAEIAPNSASVFAPYANRNFNAQDTNYKMPVSEIFYKDVTQLTTYTVDDPVTTPVTPIEWTQRIRETIQRWGNYNTGANGSGIDTPIFNRNIADIDGDLVFPLNDNGSQPNGGKYYNDPRDILGFNGATESNNARKYNNVMSPTLRRYISTTDTPTNSSVYRIDTDYNSSYNGKYYRFNGTTFNFQGVGGKGTVSELTSVEYNAINTWATNVKNELTANWTFSAGAWHRSSGTYNFGGILGINSRSTLSTSEYNDLKNLATNIVSELPANWTQANTAGALDISTGTVIDNKTAAQLKLSASGPKIQVGTDGKTYNIALNINDKRWMVDPTEYEDITGDGIQDELKTLRDGTGYGLFIENYAAMNDKSTSAGDPNFGHISADVHKLVNPLLWDGKMVSFPSNLGDNGLLDSRAEAFKAVARNAQVDAAVKAIADSLAIPSNAAFAASEPKKFKSLIENIEMNIRDIFAKMDGSGSVKNVRDFLLPFGTGNQGTTTVSQAQNLYNDIYKVNDTVGTFDFTDVTSGTISVDIFGDDATSGSTTGTFNLQYYDIGSGTWVTLGTKTITAEQVNKFPDSYKFPRPGIDSDGDGDYDDFGDIKPQPIPDENGDGNPYNDIPDGSGGYLDGLSVSYNPDSFNGRSGYNALFPGVTNILHMFADDNKDKNPFNDVPDPDHPGEFLDDPLNPRYNPPKYNIIGSMSANLSSLANKTNVQFRVISSLTGGTATFKNIDDKDTPVSYDDVTKKMKIDVQRNITVSNSSHPWGSPDPSSFYNMGIDYNSVGATTGIWESKNGLYTSVRKMFEKAMEALSVKPDKQDPYPVPDTDFSKSYHDDDLKGNPKKYIPQFSIADVDWSKIDNKTYDTLLNNPDAVGAIEIAISDLNKTFLGKQYNDIIGGSEYKGEYTSTTMSVFPGPLQFVRITDEIQSIATGGTGVQAGALQILRTPFSDTRVGPNIYYGHLSALSDGLGSFAGIGGIPTIGLFGSLVTLPIPFVPITLATNTSYDIFSDIFVSFMDRLKKVMVEAVQVQSYGASSGTAFDTYAARSEYHFSEAGFSEAMKQLKIPIVKGIDIDIGKAFTDILFTGFLGMNGLLGGSLDGKINDVSYKERLFDYKHSVQGAESRETDTGAFFATTAFLSQFEMDNLEYEYWIGTQQNEEYVNMDMQRTSLTAGKELLKVALDAALTYAASLGGSNPYLGIAFSAAKMLIMKYIEGNAEKMVYNFMYKDQNLKVSKGPFLTAGGFIGGPGEVTTEAYDFIEPDKKPYEADSDFNYPPTANVLNFLSKVFATNKPDFILDGYANTMRFRKATDSNVGKSMEKWTAADTGADSLENLIEKQMKYNQNSPQTAGAQGLGPRATAGTGADGAWTDTPLGDINEVYVGTRKISFNDLSIGFNAFENGTLGENKGTTDYGTQSVDWSVERYTGVSSRIYNNRYNPSDPVNHETFTTGMYSGVKGVDGSVGYYDRRNQYSLEFTSKYDEKFSLFGSQALNPTIGGGIKIGEIDKNKLDTQLLEYEKGGINDVKLLTKDPDDQQFGAGPDGTLNDLNRVLYEHLHLRADASNLALVNEYRDVFNSKFLKNIFISGQTYHPAGGGITSSIQIRYDPTKGKDSLQSGTREDYDTSNYDPYNTPFLTRTKGKAEIYLSTYFAYKKRAGNKKA